MSDVPSLSPAREDATHAPSPAARPLTFRAWPTRPVRGANDNRGVVIDPAVLAKVEPPSITEARPASRRRFALARAVHRVAGALSFVIAS